MIEEMVDGGCQKQAVLAIDSFLVGDYFATVCDGNGSKYPTLFHAIECVKPDHKHIYASKARVPAEGAGGQSVS
jgi:hypothetical protein